MNLAIIGTGKITERFIDAIKELDIQIEAVLSRSLERGKAYADKHNIPTVYTTLEQLCDSDIEAVYIASPNCCHGPQAIPLLERGKHVLCEKPIASCYDEAVAMFDAADKGNAVLLEAMRSVHDPGFAKIQELIGEIGVIRRVQFSFCQYSSRYDNFKNGIIENAFNPKLANAALMDIGVYCVNPVVRLLGLPEKITAESLFLHNNMEGMGMAILRYPNCFAELTYSKITQGYIPNQIQGEDGSLVIDAIEDTRRIELFKRNNEHFVFYIDKYENNMYYEALEFLNLISSKNNYHTHRKHSLDEMLIIDKIKSQVNLRFT